MKPHFSSLELLKLAISIEEEGVGFYTKNAEKASGERKELLLKLANDEKEHALVFKKMFDEFDNGSKDFDYLYDIDVESIFKAYADSEIFAKRKVALDSFEEVVEVAVKTEKLTIEYYTELEKYAKEPLKDILNRLIKEEEAHYEKLLSY